MLTYKSNSKTCHIFIAKVDATHNILDPPCMYYAFGIAMTVL